MKRIYLLPLICCVLLCACGEKKEENQKAPLLTVRWHSTFLENINTDLVTVRCKTDEEAEKVESALKKELDTFSGKTNEEISDCAWRLCNVLIESDCIPSTWVPIEANHYLNGIWSIGFAPREDEEMLRDYYNECLNLTNSSILCYDGIRYIYFESVQTELYHADSVLTVCSHDITWMSADLSILLYNDQMGEIKELALNASMHFDDERVQKLVQTVNAAVPLDGNHAIMEYEATLTTALRRYGYIGQGESIYYVKCYQNGIVWFCYSGDSGERCNVFACSEDGHIIWIK